MQATATGRRGRLGEWPLPVALAILVWVPEGIAAIRAARFNPMQRALVESAAC